MFVTLRPGGLVTREEFAAMLLRVLVLRGGSERTAVYGSLGHSVMGRGNGRGRDGSKLAPEQEISGASLLVCS